MNKQTEILVKKLIALGYRDIIVAARLQLTEEEVEKIRNG